MTLFTRRISAIYLYFLPIFIVFGMMHSCKKQNGVNDVLLKFSTPQVHFDTVFTSLPSITKRFTVHNRSNNEITTTIFLAGGKNSLYSINVDGMPGTHFKDVKIPKKDSIFIQVKVNINPENQNNPFLVTDSIVFFTGSHTQDVKLLAYGQDARYIIADPKTGYKIVAGENETVRWTKERPYVIYGSAAIDSTGTLIIEPGTKVYFHSGGRLWAYRYSKLEVNGTKDEPVLFRGDRLELGFDKDYAQWDRIWINEGADVTINNAVITNALVGVQVEPLYDGNITVTPNITVKIENTIIKNTKICGVLSRFLNIDMTNCLITNNGERSLQLEGGQYTMKHLTIANYFIGERKNETCYVSNKVALYDNYPMNIQANFINCIIYGKNETEVGVNKAKEADLEVTFQNCLIKSKNSSEYFIDCLRNEDPKFTEIDTKKDIYDLRLLPESPAIGKGKPNIGVLLDILGNSRGGSPDIGAYQYQ